MPSPMIAGLLAELREDREALQELARELAPLLPGDRLDPDEPLKVAEAAAYLKCKPRRIYDLVEQNRLVVERDGTRLILRRRHLDAYLNASGGPR